MDNYLNSITVIGVGLIGGSFARAIRKKNPDINIIGFGRGVKNLDKAVELGVIDSYSQNIKIAVKDADLVFVSSSVKSIVPTVKEISDILKPGAIITDAGSVKGEIVRKIDSFLPDHISFVGAHPIAGTENTGVEASFDTLFEGAYCVLTPTKKTSLKSVKIVRGIWEKIGSKVIEMNYEEHDRILAAVSHLPHVVAYALCNAVSRVNEEVNLVRFAAGGFKDITRIASSSPELWKEISQMNRKELLFLIGLFKNSLSEIEKFIQDEDFESLECTFNTAKKFRDLVKYTV